MELYVSISVGQSSLFFFGTDCPSLDIFAVVLRL